MAKHLICLTVLLALVVALSNATSWCSITCRKRGVVWKHSMCVYANPQPSQACNRYEVISLTSSQQNRIINYHNQARRQASATIESLQWDDTLAAVAQRWANQCQFEHDKCRDIEAGKSIGQNLAIIYGSGDTNDDLEGLMSNWHNEKMFVNRRIIASFPSDNQTVKRVGHYTQMVWRKTTKIGCGYIKYYGPNMIQGTYVSSDKWIIYLVCNYGASGNYPGEAVY